MSARRRWVVRGLLAPLILLSAVMGAPPAAAHDVVESSEPAQGATLDASPASVSIKLSDTPEQQVALTLVGPEGKHYEQGSTAVQDEVVSVAVAPLGPAGVYEIGYRVLSSDGHPITGAVPFRLRSPGPGAAPAAQSTGAEAGVQPEPGATVQPSTQAGREGPPMWPFVALVIVVVGAALALALRRRT